MVAPLTGEMTVVGDIRDEPKVAALLESEVGEKGSLNVGGLSATPSAGCPWNDALVLPGELGLKTSTVLRDRSMIPSMRSRLVSRGYKGVSSFGGTSGGCFFPFPTFLPFLSFGFSLGGTGGGDQCARGCGGLTGISNMNWLSFEGRGGGGIVSSWEFG